MQRVGKPSGGGGGNRASGDHSVYHPMSHLFVSDDPAQEQCGHCELHHRLHPLLKEKPFAWRVRQVAVPLVQQRIYRTIPYWTRLARLKSVNEQNEACAALFKFIFSNYCEEDGGKQAVWKAMCLEALHPSEMTDLHCWFKWCRDGWKTRKGDFRYSSAMAVIVSRVLPFEGQTGEMAPDEPCRETVPYPFHPADHLLYHVTSGKRCMDCETRISSHPSLSCFSAQMTLAQTGVENLVLTGIFTDAIIKASEYWPLMQDIRCSQNLSKVMAAQYRFIFGNPCEATVTQADMVNCIEMCFNKERVVLLELAAWKALCLMRASRDAQARDFYEWSFCCSVGWKVHKAAARSSDELHNILYHVIPFAMKRVKTVACATAVESAPQSATAGDDATQSATALKSNGCETASYASAPKGPARSSLRKLLRCFQGNRQGENEAAEL
jgi:hypothetical protein